MTAITAGHNEQIIIQLGRRIVPHQRNKAHDASSDFNIAMMVPYYGLLVFPDPLWHLLD